MYISTTDSGVVPSIYILLLLQWLFLHLIYVFKYIFPLKVYKANQIPLYSKQGPLHTFISLTHCGCLNFRSIFFTCKRKKLALLPYFNTFCFQYSTALCMYFFFLLKNILWFFHQREFGCLEISPVYLQMPFFCSCIWKSLYRTVGS